MNIDRKDKSRNCFYTYMASCFRIFATIHSHSHLETIRPIVYPVPTICPQTSKAGNFIYSCHTNNYKNIHTPYNLPIQATDVTDYISALYNKQFKYNY